MSLVSDSVSLRLIPAVDQVCADPAVEALFQEYSRELVVDEIRLQLDDLRRAARRGGLDQKGLETRIKSLPASIRNSIEERMEPSLRRVINATGVIIHTNIGRAPVSRSFAEKALQVASGYSNLEFDLQKGKRGHRDQLFEQRMVRLLGCEAATVCNNNAAALLLILNTFALGKKVLVSRGELVEIGGSFRIPEIMKRSGALLHEVGTTNKTRVADFENALDADTGLILVVHPSNYQIVGFTQSPALAELVQLASRADIPLAHDVGSGLLSDSSQPVLEMDPSVKASLEQGVNLVCFSGDKLLGGPQAGVIAGQAELLDQLRKNPLMRALRIDKTTYALLEQTLIAYEKNRAEQEIPVRRMIATSASEIRSRAQRVMHRLADTDLEIRIEGAESLVGGGSAPGQTIPTAVLSLGSARFSTNQLEEHLRAHSPPILARIDNDRLLIDLRTVLEGEEEEIVAALTRLGTDG